MIKLMSPRGFTPFAAILIVAVIVMLVLGGAAWWYAGSAKQTLQAPLPQQMVASRTGSTSSASTQIVTFPGANGTATWKTFRDESAGFEFQYPADVFTEVNTFTSSKLFGSVRFTDVFQATSSEGDLLLTVRSTPFDSKSDLLGVADGFSTTTIGNQTGYIYSSGGIGHAATVVMVGTRNENLQISFFWNGDPAKVGTKQLIYQDLPLIRHILSTFDFF